MNAGRHTQHQHREPAHSYADGTALNTDFFVRQAPEIDKLSFESLRTISCGIQILPLLKELHDNLDRMVPGKMPPSVYLLNFGATLTGTFKWPGMLAHIEKAASNDADFVTLASCGNGAKALGAAAHLWNRLHQGKLQGVIFMPVDGLNAQAAEIIEDLQRWDMKLVFVKCGYDTSVAVSKKFAEDGEIPSFVEVQDGDEKKSVRVRVVPENTVRAQLGMALRDVTETDVELPPKARVYDANPGSVNADVEESVYAQYVDRIAQRFREELDAGKGVRIFVGVGNGSLAFPLAKRARELRLEQRWDISVVCAADPHNPIYLGALTNKGHLRSETAHVEACRDNAGLFTLEPRFGAKLCETEHMNAHTVIPVEATDLLKVKSAVAESGVYVASAPISSPDQKLVDTAGKSELLDPVTEGVAGTAAAIKAWSHGLIERRDDVISVCVITGTNRGESKS